MIELEQRGPLAVITLNRPERRNAVDLDAVRDLARAVADACAHPGTRVLVLTGSDGHFCAGADLSGVEDTDFVAALAVALRALRDARFPTVAAVERAALGAGTQLALACDLRVATEDSSFGIPAGRLGLMVDQWTVRRLVERVGQGPARAMLLAAEVISGSRAYDIGLVERLGDLDVAVEWAHHIARLAPLSVAGHKVGCNQVEDQAPTTPEYAAAFERAWASADLQEGLAAFAERRTPHFEGR